MDQPVLQSVKTAVVEPVAAFGDLSAVKARREMDVAGLAVTPGFINMLSWSTESLIPA